MGITRRQSGIFGRPYGLSAGSNVSRFARNTKFIGVLIFLAFAFALSAISFIGNNWLRIQFIPGNVSKTRIVADVSFEYESKSRTARLYEQKKSQTSNVFDIDERSYDHFIGALKALDEQMEIFTYEHTLRESGRDDIREFVNEFVAMNVIRVEWQDIAFLISSLPAIERARVFQECISVLREIAKDGVLSEVVALNMESGRAINFLGLKLKDGNRRNVRTLEGALHYARMHLMSMDVDQDIATILFNIVKQGIRPNLVYDADESKAKFDMILRSIKPVRVKVKRGDTLLESNREVDADTYEALSEYQKALKAANRIGYGFHTAFYQKMFFGTLAMYALVFLLRIFPKLKRPTMRTLTACGVLAMAQLLALRIFIQIGELEIFSESFLAICSLHFVPPALCSSAIAMLIYGPVGGAIVSFLVSVYYTLMVSKSMEFLLVFLSANLIFIGLLKNVNFRIKIARAGVVTGAVMSIVVIAKDLIPMVATKLTLLQSCSVAVMCMSSGVLTVVLFPFFEKLFATYSNVTLLELTDYNNPILKNLQILAPGTYNHSLIAANIAEQVATHVNANAVLCKTGALYHDIGKMLKAEYFMENQNNQINLHDQQTPYMSALIIKNHVKDGIELAKEHKLPPAITDIIQQHHGTTLIQYFYDKARNNLIESITTDGMSGEEINAFVADKIEAAAFRYDGPRPKTKENLIVMLSDSIEAASRSMKRVTHQAIENLVNVIFSIKLNDHQFDECAITFDEIRDLKRAFSSVVLSMMHSRISYASARSSGGDDIYDRSE
ncbi:MAG: HDIG domain-containing protein [Puniceicoccales bacterium]|jgi:putative nucleotidyltransferase with HDIG domain|nr:HDIG domain-containing protein [Puniceicoccales bacterium]